MLTLSKDFSRPTARCQSTLKLLAVLCAFFANGAQAASNVSKDLCAQVDQNVSFGTTVKVAADVTIAGGAQWTMVAYGKGDQAVTLPLLSLNQQSGMGSSFTVKVCVDTIKLAEKWRAGKLGYLSAEDQAVVDLYFSSDTESLNEARLQNIRAEMLTYANTVGMNVRMPSKSLVPIATLQELHVRSLTGDLSGLDLLDESVGAMEDMVEALPIPHALETQMLRLPEIVSERMVQMVDGIDLICDEASGSLPGAEALSSVCDNVKDTAAAQQKLLDAIDDTGEYISTALSKVEDLTNSIAKVELLVNLANNQLHATTDTVDTAISGLQTSVDTLGIVQDRVEGTMNSVISAFSGTIDGLNTAFQYIKTNVLDVVSSVITTVKNTVSTITSTVSSIANYVTGLPSKIQEYISDLF